jgi:ABC-type multidrug transport system permease subunit
MAFTGIGLLVAARPRTIEGVSGLMNFVMLPMWIFSGVFFSPSRFPDAMLPLIRLLPLTALNDALRAVMIDGASLASVARELCILGVWGGVAFAAALRLFRWK